MTSAHASRRDSAASVRIALSGKIVHAVRAVVRDRTLRHRRAAAPVKEARCSASIGFGRVGLARVVLGCSWGGERLCVELERRREGVVQRLLVCGVSGEQDVRGAGGAGGFGAQHHVAVTVLSEKENHREWYGE